MCIPITLFMYIVYTCIHTCTFLLIKSDQLYVVSMRRKTPILVYGHSIDQDTLCDGFVKISGVEWAVCSFTCRYLHCTYTCTMYLVPQACTQCCVYIHVHACIRFHSHICSHDLCTCTYVYMYIHCVYAVHHPPTR